MNNLVRAARNILLAVGELPPNKKLIRAAFALQEALSEQAEQEHDGHWSDCSVHNEPAYPNGPCDCGGYPPKHWRCACGANLYIDSNGAPASKAEQVKQEPFDMNDHPPHRLCECRKCMEYFTPLPDCDAFAASGKPIVEQTNTQLMEGYRIGLAEMREKCAKVCEAKQRYNAMHANTEFAAAIRAINFEGDMGFRPVSEMVAEQADGEQWSPDDMAYRPSGLSMEQAEREPMYISESCAERGCACHYSVEVDGEPVTVYSAPVRTKDLTDDEIYTLYSEPCSDREMVEFARAVIAADRSKNK